MVKLVLPELVSVGPAGKVIYMEVSRTKKGGYVTYWGSDDAKVLGGGIGSVLLGKL